MNNDRLAKKIYDPVSITIYQWSRYDATKESKNNHIRGGVQGWLAKKHTYKKLKTSGSWRGLGREHLRSILGTTPLCPDVSGREWHKPHEFLVWG